jgi:hypothetical protein
MLRSNPDPVWLPDEDQPAAERAFNGSAQPCRRWTVNECDSHCGVCKTPSLCHSSLGGELGSAWAGEPSSVDIDRHGLMNGVGGQTRAYHQFAGWSAAPPATNLTNARAARTLRAMPPGRERLQARCLGAPRLGHHRGSPSVVHRPALGGVRA